MNAILKSPFAWLLKREYWESRRGFLWAPFWTLAAILGLSVLGIVAFEVFRMRNGIHLDGDGLGNALQDAFNNNTAGLVQSLDVVMLLLGGFVAIVLAFVIFFYLLGALYDDRRDRSILFWKSLPVSDTSTVISKIVAAIVIAPLIAVGVVLAGYIVAQIIGSVWFAAHGLNPFRLLWAHTDPWLTWLHLVAMIPVNAIWALPTVGWLLFWSAAVRSKPFLWAVVIPIIAAVLNFWVAMLGLPHIGWRFFFGDLFGRALFSVMPGSWMVVANHLVSLADLTGPSITDRTIGSFGMMYGTLLAPEMWIGAIVGIALIAAATWFRRWRDEV
jgi:ABC-2 type transport system permease protein